MSIQDVQTLREVVTKLVPLIAGRGVRVTQMGSQAYVITNKRTLKPERVNIPHLPDNAGEALILAVQGFIDHEVGHVLDTNWAAVAGGEKVGREIASDQKIDAGTVVPRIMNLSNLVEDPFVERRMRERFPGAAWNLEKLYEIFIERMTKPALATAKSDQERLSIIMVPVIRSIAGQKYFTDFLDAGKYWDDPLVKAFTDRLTPALRKEILTVKNSWDSLDVATQLYHILYPPPPPPPPPAPPPPASPPPPPPSPSAAEDETNPGDGTGSSDKPEDADDKGSDGEPSDEPPEAAAEDDDASDEGEATPPEEPTDSDEDADEDEEGEPDGGELDESAATPPESAGDTDGDPDGSDESEPEPAPKPESAGDEGDEAEAEKASGGSDEADSGDAGDGDGDPEEGEAEASSGGVSDDPFLGVTIEAPKDLSSAISEMITDEATRSTRGADYRIYTTEWDVIEPLEIGADYDPAWLEGLDNRTRHMVAPMQKEIERMMAARSQSVKIPGFRSGRLHSGSLHRLRVNDDRVFRRVQENHSTATAVSLVVDNSGSMYGRKMPIAMAAAYALSQTLERLKISNEVIGFTTKSLTASQVREIREEQGRIGISFSRSEPLYMPIYKGFDERLNSDTRSRFGKGFGRPDFASQNIDGESVTVAAHRLMKQREIRRVMLVFSDGQPAGGGGNRSDLFSDLHNAIENAGKMGIEVIGIGIEDDSVRSFYPNYIVLKDVAELPRTVMGELKRILLAPKK